jgi:deoxyribonuclease-4
MASKNKTLIGRHIAMNQGFVMSADISKKLGYNIFQIFLNSPTTILSKSKNKEILDELKRRIYAYDLIMVIHGSYTINLCHPPTSLKFKASIQNLVADLKSSVILGDRCLGVIIHMGKNMPENKISTKHALDNYVEGIKLALDSSPKDAILILETGAGQGNEVGSLIDGLGYIYNNLPAQYKSKVKFCVDTCHIWAVGYDISTEKGVDDFFSKFSKEIGLDKIACVHFNDSKAPLGAKVDRHADLSYGKIGSEGLKALALFAVEHNFPLIMETPLSAINMATNRDVTELEEKSLLESWIT